MEQDKKVLEQEKSLGRQEKNLSDDRIKIEEHEKKLGEQEKQLEDQERKSEEQEKKLGEQDEILGEQKKEISDITQSLQEVCAKISHLAGLTSYNRKFEVKRFSMESQKPFDHPRAWKSSAIYTHVFGYKFCIGVSARGQIFWGSTALHFFSVPGEFDDQLNWPATVKITVIVINQREKLRKRSLKQLSGIDLLHHTIL